MDERKTICRDKRLIFSPRIAETPSYAENLSALSSMVRILRVLTGICYSKATSLACNVRLTATEMENPDQNCGFTANAYVVGLELGRTGQAVGMAASP